MRGAERTFAEMSACWPQAPIYTLLYDREGATAFSGREVHSSYLQRLGIGQKGFRYLLPLFPRAVEHLQVEPYDVVVSSSSAFAHGVRPHAGAVHVCYCHSPFRYVWFEQERALSECPRPGRPLLRRTLRRLRAWDLAASERVTHYVANSEITRERIAQVYGVDSEVVHPPVAVERFSLGEPEDYLLFVGQLVRHKRADVAIEAARLAGRPIRVVGEGPERPALEARYGDDGRAQFLGSVTDERLAEIYANSLALVVPNVEEFGIAAVEAQAAGRPVVGVRAGGLRETVVDGETGLLVDGGGAASLAEPLNDVDFGRFDPETIRSHSQRFSAASFRGRIREVVDRYRDLAGT
jgi:glycosyltransferase involved in cell wall biosynthesis